MPTLKVLISGAGIAGNALAFWLSKLGHDVTVVERFPCLRVSGLQLDLRGYGIEVLKLMGLEEAFRAKSAPEQGLKIVDKSGRRWAYFPANKSGKGLQSFTTDYEIMRGDFCQLLYDATKSRARYMFNTSIASFTKTERDLHVSFENGEQGRFDLLIGADGQGSRTRKMMIQHDNPGAADGFVPLGNSYSAYLTIPRPVQDGEEYLATFYTATKSRFIMTRRHSPHRVQVYLMCSNDSKQLQEAHRRDVDAEKNIFTEIFKGAGWQADDILRQLQTSDDFYCERMGLVKLDSWSRGRVALLGDAAYCPSANTGMGTTSAVVGAYILAGEIGRHCGAIGPAESDGQDGITAALDEYERKFRPFMDQVVKGISEESNLYKYMPTGPIGIAALNCFMGLVAILRLNVLGEWVLKENVKDWTLPKYKELLQE
ncbi:FAD binding domain-containingprotein [Purpureocillium lavendulum]|uniref:FAD binding domain-containingprotein n=1 Tax=Purpureocillium lavendulum TaxID=1247861 RepID=A0AB34FTW0_9HYPO|nr:FAD binding domain-containingprotein [Purpureocillium lavendulum]